MTIKQLLTKLKDHTITDQERELFQSKQYQLFSKLSVGTISQFQAEYHNTPENERSWQDFTEKQDDMLAECLTLEMKFIPAKIRKEQNLAVFDETTNLEDI